MRSWLFTQKGDLLVTKFPTENVFFVNLVGNLYKKSHFKNKFVIFDETWMEICTKNHILKQICHF